MTIPLELSLANLIALVSAIIALRAFFVARRGQVDTSFAQRFSELETISGERMELMREQLKEAEGQIRTHAMQAQMFREHAERCDRMLRDLEKRVADIQGTGGN